MSLSFLLLLPKVKEGILVDKFFFFRPEWVFVVGDSDFVLNEEDVIEVSRRVSTYLQASF